MKHQTVHPAQFFFATAPLPCPYLPGRMERRLVTELVGRDAAELHDVLSLSGFRRSHGIAYSPTCPSCDACKAVRIDATRFTPSRTQRKIWAANADLWADEKDANATDEQYDLFARYQKSRHTGGDMEKMGPQDYQALVEDTAVETMLVELRDRDGKLVAGCLTDRVRGGLSAVYSFFEPDMARRSLGTYMILWLVERARDLGLEHVYLGFWIEDCGKMSYKSRFRPLEVFSDSNWVPFETVRSENADDPQESF